MTEVYRGFVNAWECDENEHLNVQGYVERFEIAARHAFARAGQTWDATALQVRHIRYHKESAGSDLLRIDSGRDGDTLLHIMTDAETGAILATALDTLAEAEGLADIPHVPSRDEAQPRGIPAGPDIETRNSDALDAAGYQLTHAGMVQADHVTPDGLMTDRYFIARVTDAVVHAWGRAGFTKAWLNANNYGRVAVEMKLTIGSRPKVGSLLHLVSGLTDVGRSTVTIRHVFVDTETGIPFATTVTTALTMDLETRRAVRFDEDMRAYAETVLVG